jgi:hypothetical protein
MLKRCDRGAFGAFGAVTAALTSPRRHFTRQVELLSGHRINRGCQGWETLFVKGGGGGGGGGEWETLAVVRAGQRYRTKCTKCQGRHLRWFVRATVTHQMHQK